MTKLNVTDVKIPRRMTISELSLLSRSIKAEANANGRFHIFYYLPEMIVDNGAWAGLISIRNYQ
ncbi:MAG: hypothetical protein IPG39_16320 [Bacteroidetes bacterium]|nr:hypothetical protein [Bacteroidota bacterium]